MVNGFKRLFFAISIISTLASSGLQASFPEPDIRILRSDQSGLTLEYSPLLKSTSPTRNETALIDLPHHGISNIPGEYPLPLRKHLVALPQGAAAVLNIESVRTKVFKNIKLEKVPLAGDDGAFQAEGFERARGKFVSVSEPFRFRRFWAVEVTLQPCKYNSDEQSLEMAETIRFSLDFKGGNPGGYTEPKSEWLEPMILNLPQARNWAYPPARRLQSGWPQGTLLEILVEEEGMYRIGFNEIQQLGLDPSDYPLSRIRLYNNGGRELPTELNYVPVDSLIENAILLRDLDGDDVFDPGDFIVFYGRGTLGWEEIYGGEFRHYINHYTYDNSYWLELSVSGPTGKRMEPFGVQDSPSVTVHTTKGRVYREDERVIYGSGSFPGSGLEWYGDLFAGGESRTYRHSFRNVASGYLKIRAKLLNVLGSCTFQVYFNNSLLPGTINTGGVQYIPEQDDITREGDNSLMIKNILSGSAYLDWYEIEYERRLQAENGSLFFESPLVSGIAYFDSLTGFTDSVYIFKINDYANVRFTRGIRFKDNLSTTVTQRYCAFDEGALMLPKSIAAYHRPRGDFEDLRSVNNRAQHLYITHGDFYDGIAELAELWENLEGISTARVDVAQIFDQFSWGLYDPVAIRLFLQQAVDNWAEPPASVTLVGDGDYDYFNRLSPKDKNWIPAFEEGLICYDDYYAFLHTVLRPEVALGRLTVNSTYELGAVTEKIISYASQPDYGPWRNRITLVADDEYKERGVVSSSEILHVRDTESLAQNHIPRFFSLKKIYLTEYPVVPGAGGRQKPNAAEDLIAAINSGCIIVNYFGHGNETVWAHEAVFLQERDLSRIDNGGKLPLFIGATCTWGYFDNPLKQSFPEELLAAPGRGAIACIGATRTTASVYNDPLVRGIFNNCFGNPYEPLPIGLSLMKAKLSAVGWSGEKYHLFGDPMVRLASPRNSGEITAMEPDSMFAFNLTQVSGRLFKDGAVWNDFNGIVYLEVFDAAKMVEYEFHGLGSTVTYELPGNTIFRGPVSALEGAFQADFIIPKDITYGGELGRINFYFYENERGDGVGFIDSIYIGSGGYELTDSDHPAASIYFGDRSYKPGNTVSSSPLFIADLTDTSGINLTGAPGFEIKLVVDDNQEHNLTDYFEYDIDSHRAGALMKNLDYLGPGAHRFKLRFYDNFDNPGQVSFTVETADSTTSGEFLYSLLNYPNPFSDRTTFTFWLLKEAEVKIEIYTVGGRKIKTLGPRFCAPSLGTPFYVYDQFHWRGRDLKGDKVANGAYLYKVKADFGDKTVSKIGRIIVMR